MKRECKFMDGPDGYRASHIHLVFRSAIQKPDEVIRDFKSVTSKKLVRLIDENMQEIRREWLLNSFKKAAANSNNTKNHPDSYRDWQQHNHPIELWTEPVFQQKMDYTHHNPVEAGFVENDYEYLYSSARDYCGTKGLVKIIMD